MDFEQRLQKAIERGQRAGDARAEAAARAALNEREIRRLYAQYRLELSERIEAALKQVADHLPGFQFENVVGDRGWGGAVSRNDINIQPDRTVRTLFSRLEIVVRPLNTSHVLELAAKGTVRNKEIFNRTQYQQLGEADLTSFHNTLDLWILEYAETFAGQH